MSHILYVEDNEENIYMLSHRLKKKGFEVSIARDGQEGVDMAVEIKPDIILMDLGLPVMDGWEATQKIKAAPETAHIPIIVLTAHALPDALKKAKLSGADELDIKPVDFPGLLKKIAALLSPLAAE